MKLAAISVDLDELPNYFAIHDLPVEPRAANLVYDVALARLADWASSARVPISAFAIGADIGRAESTESLRAFARRGHVVENHSLHHRYDLTRLDRAAIRSEIEGGARAIERCVGRRPSGFRAPGYTITDEVFDVLEELEIAWDSSVFPCPSYWSAKAIVLATMRARGKTSASILDTPRVLGAPTAPYRVGDRWYHRGARRVLELPIQVTRGLRLPFIGTSVMLAGVFGAKLLARQCVGDALVNLELHGIDFLDASDGLATLSDKQRELRVPLARRLDALDAAIAVLRAAGYAFVTLEEAAAEFA